MSAQLVARGLSAEHGSRTLFDSVDLVVAPGSVTGLVGPNGAGKSTLLRLLAGLEVPAAGAVSLQPPDATVGLLPQETDRVPGETVLAHLARRTGVAAAQEEMDAATLALADGSDGADDRYATALERWLALGGADLDARVPQVAADVGLDVDGDQAMTTLSGGQAARVSLAALLLSRFDVLLLDEPTNDLDLAGLDRLERFVAGAAGGIVVVSHDREFLTRTTTQVLELDRHQRSWHLYGGGYESYLTERARAREQARERYEEYADTVQTLSDRARTQRAWADKGAGTARRDRSERDKFIRHHNIATSEQLAAKARRTEKAIERLEEVDEPRKEWELRFSIAGAPPSGQVVAVASGAVVRRGDFTLGPVTLQVDRGDRIAITGPNGSGKSTLLSLLLGRLAPDEGTAGPGASVRIGEVDQARAAFGDDRTLLDAFVDHVRDDGGPDMTTSEVRTLLAKFGLGGEQVARPASGLSPGERTRAALALLQARSVNVLVLDEPTNHLDLPAIEQLEQALDSFDGTLLLVSHDRRLLEAVRVERRVEVLDGRVTEA
ncbi:ABC-F family ATP-binding cassette domain-containing protein [Dermatobacter hominis]|uniref:ABC-F family ATP-binding cassette domain-containing protein n=1 Tax=Dermatobacter hominis TaxID=2884263 RepID=UPI001D0F9509|nr:ABC-F family ATP-binding cassette domain-containing protein [Dermatobacter hominis]UDY35740.1 ATP-binding cassette domain-containing protein [Dermatobacter hominis]